MKRLSAWQLKVLAQTMALSLFLSCGVEVGNPTKPVAPSEEDQAQLALVSGEQLEETIAAASENQSASGSLDDTGLMLKATRTCDVGVDRSVTYVVDKTDAASVDLPLKNPTTRVAQTAVKHVSTIMRSLPTANGLACRLGGRLPALDWSVLTSFQAEVTATRTVDKTFSDIALGSLNDTVHVAANGSRQVSWERLSYADDLLLLQKSVHFETNLKRTSTKADGTYDTTVRTEDNLVIQQSVQGLDIKSFVMVSGSVLSDYKDGQAMKLAYSNLEFIKGSSCYPQSGSIAGSIYAQTDLTTALFTFTLMFDGGQGSLVFADGSVRPLLLADCTIKGD